MHDSHFTLYVGDVRDVLAELPDRSVDCVVTSPPYWGLRDYGTGTWEGGDPDCDHLRPTTSYNEGFNERWGQGGGQQKQERKNEAQYPLVCEKCQARRVDRQLGLEATPEEYVEDVVAVFREIRRVLADHGTVWLNLGDSYNNRSVSRKSSHQGGLGFESEDLSKTWTELRRERRTRVSIRDGVLKEKDLVGIPWRTAFALQADGWWLRSDIIEEVELYCPCGCGYVMEERIWRWSQDRDLIWKKPNPMPEAIKDRPTKSHEYLFMFAKQARYYWDQEAVKEPATWDRWGDQTNVKYADETRGGLEKGRGAIIRERSREELQAMAENGRNIRSVWTVATKSYPEAHFATFPEELVEPMIKASCPEWVCRTCGKPRERIVETDNPSKGTGDDDARGWPNTHSTTSNAQSSKSLHRQQGGVYSTARTVGWTDCGHDDYRPGIVLDPFMGSGTVAVVARQQRRSSVGVELNPEYAELARKRFARWWKAPAQPRPKRQDLTLFELDAIPHGNGHAPTQEATDGTASAGHEQG